MQEIKVTLTKNPKPKPDFEKAGFGKIFTDHMFMMDYNSENGWHNAQIMPYSPLALDPSTCALHYGQALFEGMKAYRSPQGKILLFRPRKNMERMNISGDRICIPPIDEDFAVSALMQLLKIDADWVPNLPGMSLYIRPFIFACDAMLGVHPSDTYKFMIIMSPVTTYYTGGLTPAKILVEDKYVRSVKGGTGNAKVIGNYAASLRAQANASKEGFSQVLWLDGVHRKYVEEVGSMNIFFKIGDTLVTPELSGSILPGITRASVIEIAHSMGLTVDERLVSIDELLKAADKGELKEIFGSGTAVVISPVGQLKYKDRLITVNGGIIGPVTQKIYDTLTGIQFGTAADPYGWRVEIN